MILRDLTEVKQAYLEWLLDVPSDRTPPTKRAFAEEHDIAFKTLYNWEKSDEFREALLAVRKDWGAVYQVEVLARLMKVITEGRDSDAIAAAKVLFGHLDLGIAEDKKDQVDEQSVVAWLEEQGFAVKSKE